MTYLSKLGILGPGLDSGAEVSAESSNIEALVKHIKTGQIASFISEAKSLAAKGFDFNTPTTGGWTCLHYAAYMGRSTAVSELLSN